MREDLIREYLGRKCLLDELCSKLEEETREALSAIDHIDRISFRVKDVDSFVNKAFDPTTQPAYTYPLVEIEDQVAGRVIVFFLSDLTRVHNCLSNTFTFVERSHKRPQRDEEFGYESHHLICIIPPHLTPSGWSKNNDLPTTFELQVRTIFMHAYAEPQHDVAYKGPGDLPSDMRKELAWIAASAWGADQAYERVREWEVRRLSAQQAQD